MPNEQLVVERNVNPARYVRLHDTEVLARYKIKLHNMLHKLVELGKNYGIKINSKKIKNQNIQEGEKALKHYDK